MEHTACSRQEIPIKSPFDNVELKNYSQTLTLGEMTEGLASGCPSRCRRGQPGTRVGTAEYQEAPAWPNLNL